MTRTTTFVQAVYEAVRFSLAEQPELTVIGNWVFGSRNAHLSDALHTEFPGQIIEPSVAEGAIVATACGAAMAGVPSIVSLGTATFAFPAYAGIFNEASIVHHLSNGQLTAPMTLHMMHGLRGGGGEQHSYSPQSLFWNCPGLEIVVPSTPRDAKGLMRTALRSPNPTVFIDHQKLSAITGDVPEEDYATPFGSADIKRSGDDVTMVATSRMVHVALEAAEELAEAGLGVEVVDPRTLEPLDEATILGSVRRTGRLVTLDEGTLRCGVAAELTSMVTERLFDSLKAAPVRLTRKQSPVAFSRPLEASLLPDAADVVAAVRGLVGSARVAEAGGWRS